jgi:hypothetical protein
LKYLAQSGVVVPDHLDPFDENIHVDFTAISSRGIGGVHSRFCNRLAHALYLRSQLEAERLTLSRRIHLAHARYRLKHEGEYKTVKMLESAMILDPEIKKLEKHALQIDVKSVALDAVLKGYESIAKAASREMARRGMEAGNVSRD